MRIRQGQIGECGLLKGYDLLRARVECRDEVIDRIVGESDGHQVGLRRTDAEDREEARCLVLFPVDADRTVLLQADVGHSKRPTHPQSRRSVCPGCRRSE